MLHRATATCLADMYKDKVQGTLHFKISEMKMELERERKVSVSIHKCKRAKRKIRHEMEGSFKDEFAKLEGYCKQMMRDDPGSDVVLSIDDDGEGTQVFRRLYVCFNAVKVCL